MKSPTELAGLAFLWGGEKTVLSRRLGIEDDGLHAMVGVGLLLLLALVTGRRLDDWRLWLAVLAAECLNEALDLANTVSPEATWAESRHDLLVTMALPTAILLLLRFTDRRRPQAAASTASASAANRAVPSSEE